MNTSQHLQHTEAGLFTKEFVFLCSAVFMTLCNVAVFYDLHIHIQSLDIAGERSGFLIGLYSLTTMLLYIAFSPSITPQNAPRNMIVGSCILIACGFSYLAADSFLSLAAIRIVGGIGTFYIMASAMVLLVSVMPPEKTGQGFSFYSAFILLPYAFVPFMRSVLGYENIPPTYWYAGMTLLLLPLLVLPSALRLTQRSRQGGKTKPEPIPKVDILQNIKRLPVVLLLSAQTLYFISFSALFFLLKDYALSLGVADIGLFFTIQMLVMVAVRVFAARLFDNVNQKHVVILSFFVTTVGFLLLAGASDRLSMLAIAVVFGLGTGMTTPPLNSLMFHASQPKFRGMNANFMMLVLHLGMFLGPTLGSITIEQFGYEGFLFTFAGVNVTAALLFFFFTDRPSPHAQA